MSLSLESGEMLSQEKRPIQRMTCGCFELFQVLFMPPARIYQCFGVCINSESALMECLSRNAVPSVNVHSPPH